jgi:hypothetical protein
VSDDLSARREAILQQMLNEDGSVRDVLFSDLRRALGIQAGDEAFEGLRRDGVICAYFPEAKPGDSGRQFWGFANVSAEPPAIPNPAVRHGAKLPDERMA